MRIPGIRRLRKTATALTSRFSSRVLIVLYHRIRPGPCDDPYVLGVTPEHFAEHLEIYKKYGRPMGLQDLARSLRENRLPRRAVVVTFDDGYADNLYQARPVLEDHEFPATVFVTAGYVGESREFWWDELDRLLLQPGTLADTLVLDIDGSRYQWDLGTASSYDDREYRRHQSWQYGSPDEPTPRHRIFRALYQQLAPLAEGKRRQVLESLRMWAKADPQPRASHRILSADEVIALADDGLIEVGGHTVTHPILSSLPLAAQEEEIHGSRSQLERILGREVYSFAYPYGSRARGDYTDGTVELVRQTGFTCACSNLAQPVQRNADNYQLPRATVKDWSGDELARRLEVWFGG